MLPSQLNAASFKAYPPEARALAIKHTALFQQLPLAFLPLLLGELIQYDWKFPAEREDLDHQLAYLEQQTPAGIAELTSLFAKLTLSDELQAVDWVNIPAEFSERLSAFLWASHQIDAFRTASLDYVHRLNAAKPAEAPPLPRLGMVLIGKDTVNARGPLFRRMLPLGVHYTNVAPEHGKAAFFETLKTRAAAHPIPFAHWYIDGGNPEIDGEDLTCISYAALRPLCDSLQAKMLKVMSPGGGGPELLRSQLQRLKPEDVGFGTGINPALSHFELSLLTEGSGTQIFSTTFVQWAAREALRRAQPYTLLARYTPRRLQATIGRPIPAASEPLDPNASLVDADMGAYYTWINQQRLPNAAQARFVVWYEAHKEAFAIGPGLSAGTQDTQTATLKEILARVA